ncbi:hypothetical protein GCM10007100_23870 [Roseibacillus persicicus]|uniref:Tetratricopeptide repeat protein n=1 Tax=Roseibacillus persicicus TaxID=454148 RepID=A0A918TTR4_9BACT|nr:hypothetical protein GCM10007100_23870 [Roseibacillus persicicus]
MTRLDELALTHSGDSVALGKIGSLAADTQFRLGRFHEAAAYYSSVLATLVSIPNLPRAWYRPALGEVRSLAKAASFEEANLKAAALWQTRADKEVEFDALLASSDGTVVIEQQPVLASEAATQLGNLFLQEGQTSEAKQWYEQAIGSSPKAYQAHLALARLALAADDAATAQDRADYVLTESNFQAVSVAAWPLLITSRVRQEAPAFPEALYQSMIGTARQSVRDRCIVDIVKTLRSFDDPNWKTIAEHWLQSDSMTDEVPAVELAKMVLADEKINGGAPSVIALAAHRVLHSDRVSPSEVISCSKSIVRSLLQQGELLPDFAGLAAKAERLFGLGAKRDAIHGMALSAAGAGSLDLARPMFQSIIDEPGDGGAVRKGKATWALARLESEAGNHHQAALLFLSVSEGPGQSAPIRMQALRLWLEELRKTDSDVDDSEVISRIDNVLAGIAQPALLLDIGRQLSLIPGTQLNALREHVYEIAETSAWEAFLEIEQPSTALKKLIHLTRRQYFDFVHTAKIVSQWHSLSTEKRAWLRNDASHWWEYLSLVFQSLIAEGDRLGGEDLAAGLLNSDEVTPEGYVWLGSAYANWKIRDGDRPNEGLSHFDWIIQEQPTHQQASWGYYWKGLAAWKAGRTAEAAEMGRRIRLCYAGKPSFTWQWILDAVGCLLQSSFDVDTAMENFPETHTRRFFEQSATVANREMRKF